MSMSKVMREHCVLYIFDCAGALPRSGIVSPKISVYSQSSFGSPCVVLGGLVPLSTSSLEDLGVGPERTR